ncbi:MAG: DHA2 family efflux MFS transporter permease subunit [Rhodospirillales bacterium]|nr:DHA2 family efflux MFS transporter permease subunit [Rhodospirillales bacterium]
MTPDQSHQVVPHRALITLCCMTGNLMQALDSTIANVSLPYMQGTLSTSAEEITWVLTSYVIAAAIMTAPVGWMAVRFGRKNLFIGCMSGFVVASMLCGAAETLPQMVAFRILQGMCGAALVPLSQATMLDIYPFERRAQAMAIFGMGVMVGPILGPTLGGYLTEMYNWRWVFYVNLPFGVLALVGLALFMPKAPVRPDLRFDWTGFAVLALAVGALQLMLDRGQRLDWFTSREIVVEAVLAGLGFYLFVVHMLTARDPFLPPALFKDRNFTCGVLMVFCVAMILLASSALLAPYLESLAGYPVETAGIAMAPRGLGTMLGMQLAARLSVRFDQRAIMALGLVIMGASLHAMSGWTPDVTERQMMLTLIVQGVSMGFVFNPMTVMAFVTLPSQYRGHATSLQALGRNIGQAIGVSVTSFTLTRSIQTNHADIAAGITPFARVLQGNDAVAHWLDPFTRQGAALLDRMIEQQAQIIAYNNDFRMMTLVVVPPLLLLPFMRRHAPPPPIVAVPAPAAMVAPPPATAPAAGAD